MIANEWCAQAVTIEGVKKLVALTMDNIQAWDKFHLLVLFYALYNWFLFSANR